MKNKSFFTTLLAIMLVFGMGVIGCNDGSGDDGTGTGGNGDTITTASFAGTWNASGGRSIVFTSNNFNYKVNGTTQYQGTFSVSGSTITFNESSLGTASGNFSLSAGDASTGSTLTLSNHTWDSSVNGTYTKEGGDTITTASFAGTWNASGNRSIVFTSNNFNYKVNGTTQYQGTFSISGSTITFNESSLGTASGGFSLTSTTLTLSNHTWDSSVNGTYTKDGGSGNSGSDLVLDDGWAWIHGYTGADGDSGIIFKSDGTVLNIDKESDVSPWVIVRTSTYTVTDGTITVTAGGQTTSISYSISGNTLSFNGNPVYVKGYVGSLNPTPSATYIITGSGTTFTATKDGVTVGTANQTMSNTISAIRTDANGADIGIQFGSGTDVLNIGTVYADFNNTGGTWGTITLSGKITSANGTYTVRTSPDSNVSIISTADITNTSSSGDGISNGKTCTLTINGGTVEATQNGRAIINIGTLFVTNGTIKAMNATNGTNDAINNRGTATVNGGTISSNRYAISNSSAMTINSGTISTTSSCAVRNTSLTTADGNVYGTLTIAGGTITSTTTSASDGTVTNYSAVTTTITGGTITAPSGGYALYNGTSGTMTAGGTAVINGNTYGVTVATPAKYIITGSGTTFTATKGSETVGTANQEIGTVLTAIKNDAGSADYTVQFGDGATALNIGATPIGLGSTGTVTITGKITATMGSSDTIGFSSGNVISEADITVSFSKVTSNRAIIRNGGTGTLTVTSGSITANGSYESGTNAGIAIHNESTGSIIVNGGTVKSSPYIAILNKSTGTVTINGGTVTGTSSGAETIRNSGGGTVTITNGTVSSTGSGGSTHAISNSSNSTLNISGGTVSKSGDSGYAISNGGGSTTTITNGTVTRTGSGNTIANGGTTASGSKLIISGGKVTGSFAGGLGAQSNATISNQADTVTITGGTVENTGTGGYAINNSISGTVTVTSPPAVITGLTAGY